MSDRLNVRSLSTAMKMLLPSLLLPSLMGIALSTGISQGSVSSNPIGFNKVTLTGNANTMVSLPFTQKAVFTGKAGTVVDAGGDGFSVGEDAVVTPAGTSISLGSYSSTHYVRFSSGNRDGYYYEIASNSATTLTVMANGDDLSQLAVDDTFSIIPHWTLDTVFPGGEGVYETLFSFNPLTQVFIPDVNSSGENLALDTFFYKGGVWCRADDVNGNYDGEILYPNTMFVVRHRQAGDTTICASGVVPMGKHVLQFDVLASGKNDHWISLDRPVPTTLAQSNLVESGAFLESTFSFNPVDVLFVYDESLNIKTYFYLDGMWQRQDALGVDQGAVEVFGPGLGVIIRKGSGASDQTVFGVNNPTYGVNNLPD